MLNELTTTDDFRDSPAFKDYQRKIKAILIAAKRPMSIRDIHNALGDNALIRWTADALEGLGLEEVGVLPTRYVFREMKPMPKIPPFTIAKRGRTRTEPIYVPGRRVTG